jgi:hypothetical protein
MMLLFVLDLDVHMPTFPENTIFYEKCMIFAYTDDVGQAHFDSVPQVVMGGKERVVRDAQFCVTNDPVVYSLLSRGCTR